MLARYRNLTEQQKLQEYARLKREYYRRNGHVSAEQYDAFINKITRDLGI